MTNKIIFRDLGSLQYAKAWDYQRQRFTEVTEAKFGAAGNSIHYLLFCEHPHVYTIGKSGNDSNLLISEDLLKSYGAELFHIDRGGDITYHGPGQIVGYPILDLQKFNIGIKDYVSRLEEAIIITLENYGIKAGRLEGATGVWLDAGTSKARKICAIGVRASRYVTMHGFAFNINTDLNYFNHINPCGFTDKGVTSLSKELGKAIDINEVKGVLKKSFEIVFNAKLIKG
jgi:lipoyl(octanoyl) transferase